LKSVVSIPEGAKRIGNYILGKVKIIKARESVQELLEKYIWGCTF